MLPGALSLPVPFARRAFGVALAFLVVVAGLGALLRWHTLQPVPGLNYGYFLHAHSHAAFLGWIFNAFLALALVHFIPAEDNRFVRRLFVLFQIAVAGMLVAFPIQGYAPVSIAFSTLHMGGSFAFAWRLWRRNHAVPLARGPLRVALVFLVASGLGPLALGPLAANGLRDTPAYHLAVYFYLHTQYNGWFLFFLQALLLQTASSRGLVSDEVAARRATGWLAAGTVLTFAQSTLWLAPPAWVYVVAALGGLMQLLGCGYLAAGFRGALGTLRGPVRWLTVVAVGAFVVKHGLQAAAAWPALGAFGSHRFIVIAFLHLVFLGVVTPALLAWAIGLGWLRDSGPTRAGLALLIVGAGVTEILLVAVPFGLSPAFPLASSLVASAVTMLAGAVLLLVAYRGRGAVV